MIRDDRAKEEALRAFLSSHYEEAIRISVDYQNQRGRGAVSLGGGLVMGGPPPMKWMVYAAQVEPKILSALPRQLLEELRNEAVAEELFGDEDRRKWAPGEMGIVPFERQFAKNMIRFAANQLYELDGLQHVNVKRVRIQCAGITQPGTAREYTCLACRSLHQTIWQIEDHPELPWPSCTGYYGCRCRFDPIFE